jgi:hypothetical protein
VPEIAASIIGRSPRLQDWAPTMAGLLGLELPDADGIDLLEGSELASAG